MKRILFIFHFLIPILATAQIQCETVATMEYVSKQAQESFYPVGRQLKFMQFCTKDIDSVITTGNVLFQNQTVASIPGQYRIYIQDGVLIKSLFQTKGKKNLQTLLDHLKLSHKKISCSTIDKKMFHFHWHEDILGNTISHIVSFDGVNASYLSFIGD